MLNGFAPAGAPNGFAPPTPPPPPPNGFAPPVTGAGAPNGLDGRESLLDPPNGFAAVVAPNGLGFVVVVANGLGALAAPPPAPALKVNVGAEGGAAVAALAPKVKPPLTDAPGAGATAPGADEPKANGAAAFASACFCSTVAAEGAAPPKVNGEDDAGVGDAGGVPVVGFATAAPNKLAAAGDAAGAAPKVNVAGFAVSAGFAAPKANVAGAAGLGASAAASGLGAPKTNGEVDTGGAEVVVEVVPKGEGFVSPSSFLEVSVGVGSFAAAPKPVKAGGFAVASFALGAFAKPPPKLKVVGFAGSSFFTSSFFSFVDAKKPSKPLFSTPPVAAGPATAGGAVLPKVNVGAADAGLARRGAAAFVGSVDVVAAGENAALGVDPAKVNFAVDGFTSPALPLPSLGPSGARKWNVGFFVLSSVFGVSFVSFVCADTKNGFGFDVGTAVADGIPNEKPPVAVAATGFFSVALSPPAVLAGMPNVNGDGAAAVVVGANGLGAALPGAPAAPPPPSSSSIAF